MAVWEDICVDKGGRGAMGGDRGRGVLVGRFSWKGGGVVLGFILGGGMDRRMLPSGCGCPLNSMSVAVVLGGFVAVVGGATGFVGWLGWSMVGSGLGAVGCCWFVVGLVVL